MKNLKIISVMLAVVIAAGVFAGCDQNRKLYEEADVLLREGNFKEAADAFEALGDYNDAAAKALVSRYVLAFALFDNGSFIEAAAAFEALGDYNDAAAKALASRYALAVALFDNGNFVEAAAAFGALGDYSDAPARADESKFNTVFPITYDYREHTYTITGYQIGNTDGKTAIVLQGDIVDLINFGAAGTLPVPSVACLFEAGGTVYNTPDVAFSLDFSVVSWIYRTVAYPETIIIRDGTGVDICSFNIEDVPQKLQ